MKIIADENIPFVKHAFSSIGEVKTFAGRLICRSKLATADILLVRSITQVNTDLLNQTPIKFVASATSGIDHIDVEYLHQNNIAFAQALGSNAISVAQYVISGLCYWSIHHNKPLKQMSIGIIGCGQVGSQVEKLCRQLGIKCILNDPPLADKNKNNFKNLETAMACDVVSLHVPLTHHGKYATKHLINMHNIQQLKSDCLLINTARGGVVDEQALLKKKSIDKDFSIILDVWENEPNLHAQILSQCLIATPHIAGYSYDGKVRGTAMIYRACCQFFNKTEQWSDENIILDGHHPCQIDSSKKQDIRESILQAYNILEDDKQLRQMLSHPHLFNADYFDSLRKNYPIRREWKGIF